MILLKYIYNLFFNGRLTRIIKGIINITKLGDGKISMVYGDWIAYKDAHGVYTLDNPTNRMYMAEFETLRGLSDTMEGIASWEKWGVISREQ